jgi:hypothetical protein
MLPGFRFLFATVVLAASVLIFGLGAAALLRAAHEELASLAAAVSPAPRPLPAGQDAMRPTLALLRIETPDIPAKLDPVRGTAAAADAKPVIVARNDDAGADAPPPAPDAAPSADPKAAEGTVAGAAADPAESMEKELSAGAQTPELQTGGTPVPDLHGSDTHAIDNDAAINDNASGGSSSDAAPLAAQPTRMASSHAEEQATAAVTEPVRPAVTVGKRTRTTTRRHLTRARAAARARALQQQQTPSNPLTQLFGGGRNSTSDPRS